jgi:hypothetical protein
VAANNQTLKLVPARQFPFHAPSTFTAIQSSRSHTRLDVLHTSPTKLLTYCLWQTCANDSDCCIYLERMDSFFVSAPGKVILFGEHAVVHEKVCIPISAFAQPSSLSCKRLASMETDL